MSPDSSTLDARGNQKSILVTSLVTVTKISHRNHLWEEKFIAAHGLAHCNGSMQWRLHSQWWGHEVAASHNLADLETDEIKQRLSSNARGLSQVTYFLQCVCGGLGGAASHRLCNVPKQH